MQQALAETPVNVDEPAMVLDADSAGQLFELIGKSELIKRGQAMLVSIAPIKTALGQRWAGRREQVYGLTDRYLQKHLAPGDICQRTGEVHFLVAAPAMTPVAVRAVCYRGLMEVLTHFLGEVKTVDLEVCQVSELSADRVQLQTVSAADLRKADAEAPAASAGAVAPAAATPLSSLASWPLKTADGKDLHVSFAVDPVLELKAWAMAGHRIESRIVNLQTEVELTTRERRNLMPHDFERIDLAALERGLSRLEGVESFDRPRLIIQLSFASLSNNRARAALLSRARELQHVMRHAAICELVDVEPGIPESRLTEVTSLIHGFFRSIWVQVEPSRATIVAAMGAKASGLTVRAGDLGESAEQIADGMRTFMSLVKTRNLLLTVTSLPTTDLMIDAMATGFTHATLRAKQPPSRFDPPTAPV
jgi:hypothetical protein